MKKAVLVTTAVLGVVGLGVGIHTIHSEPKPDTKQTTQATCEDPKIKGNISMATGEKIYHMPGDRFYDATIIDESQGEKLFCTPQEAEAAGWRHSER